MSIELLIEEERKSIKQIEDARTKAEKKIADSQKEAQKILDQAIKKEFIQKYLRKEEEKVNEEAKKVLNKYKKDVAKIIDVEEATIWNWENNRTSPKLHYIPKIVEFLDYVPCNIEPKTLGERIVNYRRLLGITQKELAYRLGVDPSTLARWERNNGRPLKKL